MEVDKTYSSGEGSDNSEIIKLNESEKKTSD